MLQCNAYVTFKSNTKERVKPGKHEWKKENMDELINEWGWKYKDERKLSTEIEEMENI